MRFTDYSFTPSEHILLNGEKYAQEAEGKNSLPLLISDKIVNGPELAASMLAAAILVNESENALILEVRRSRKLFVAALRQDLYLRPGGVSPNWSGFTIESAVLFISRNLHSIGAGSTVRNLVYTMLTENQREPWKKIIELVEWGLASSNWLIPVEGEAAAAFSTPFICPEKVRELALQQPAAPFKDLLSACRKTRPEIWNLMMEEIDQAFRDRKS